MATCRAVVRLAAMDDDARLALLDALDWAIFGWYKDPDGQIVARNESEMRVAKERSRDGILPSPDDVTPGSG